MTDATLKLVKSKKGRANWKKQSGMSSVSNLQSPISNYQLPELSSAEHAEMARFRTFTKDRAALQARVRQLVTQLNEHQARKAA